MKRSFKSLLLDPIRISNAPEFEAIIPPKHIVFSGYTGRVLDLSQLDLFIGLSGIKYMQEIGAYLKIKTLKVVYIGVDVAVRSSRDSSSLLILAESLSGTRTR
jgi:hypothetical protein